MLAAPDLLHRVVHREFEGHLAPVELRDARFDSDRETERRRRSGSMDTCAPTESSPGSRCASRKSRHAYSTSLTMRGVAYTMPSLPMKPMQRASSTMMDFAVSGQA